MVPRCSIACPEFGDMFVAVSNGSNKNVALVLALRLNRDRDDWRNFQFKRHQPSGIELAPQADSIAGKSSASMSRVAFNSSSTNVKTAKLKVIGLPGNGDKPNRATTHTSLANAWRESAVARRRTLLGKPTSGRCNGDFARVKNFSQD
jgi:hypothetical protein